MNNRKHFLATLICSGAIVASVNVIAQSYGQDSRQRNDSSRGTTMGSGAVTKTESANSAFKRLDANKRGYLTNEDVRSMQGFDSACDKNSDGRITRSEFRPCWDTWSRNQASTPSVGSMPSNSTTGAGSSGAGTAGSGAPGSTAMPGGSNMPTTGMPSSGASESNGGGASSSGTTGSGR